MDTAITFFSQHFKQGLCYPAWIDDNEEFAMRNVAKQVSSGNSEDRVGASSTKGMNSSLLSIAGSEKSFVEKDRCRVRAGGIQSICPMESRDTHVESSFLASLRDTSLDDGNDLDEVIKKIIRKRDDLINEKLQAGEEIKRLKLENENLRNLNAIAKRLAACQKDELTQLKINAVKDKNQLNELQEMLDDLRKRTADAQHALDGSSFLSGIGVCNEPVEKKSGEVFVEKIPIEGPGILDSVFGWTIDE